MDYILDRLKDFFLTKGLDILGALVVLVVGLWLIRLAVKIISKSKAFRKADPGVSGFLNSFISIALKVVLFLTCISMLGIPIVNFATLLGTVGVAAGLAMQGSLSNLMGGFMILVFKPFKVGDFIDTHTDSGTVQSIAIFYTTLITADNRKVVIPNGALSNATVVNYSETGVRKLILEFSVSYDSDMEAVKALLVRCAENDPLSLDDPAPSARLKSHGDSALVFMLAVWVKTDDYWTLHYNLMENVKKAFDENGIEIPFPQLDIHTKND